MRLILCFGSSKDSSLFSGYELLFIIKQFSCRNHGKNLTSIIEYMTAFWNTVDLRYREITNPKIHLNVAGIVVPEVGSQFHAKIFLINI